MLVIREVGAYAIIEANVSASSIASSLAKTIQQPPISSNVPRWRLEIQDHVDNTRLANSLKKYQMAHKKINTIFTYNYANRF